MDSIDILRDFAARPLAAVEQLGSSLAPEVLNAHPGGHDNSIAWLLWHIGREIDAQVAHLSGREQLWTREGFQQRFGISEAGVGVGHTSAQARGVTVDAPALLVEYVAAATAFLEEYLATLSPEDLDEVIDSDWDPPVTRGVRIVSIVDDAAQHAGQVGYALGILAQQPPQ